MIVTCTECDTQFRLDDSKVAGTGLNVRCSICKHAFFVPAPGAEVEEVATDPAAAFDRVAGAAAEAAFSDVPSPTPEVTRDLAAPDSDASIDDEDEIATTIAPSRGGEFEGESDWEFSHDRDLETSAGEEEEPATVVAAAAERAVDDLLGPGPPPQVAPEVEEDAGLGDPGDWDFFGNEGGDLGADRAPAADPIAPATGAATVDVNVSPESGDVLPQGVDRGVFPDESSADLSTPAESRVAFPEDNGVRPVPFALRRAGNAIGWVSVFVLFTFGIHSGLKIQRVAPTHLETQSIAGTNVETVEGRWIENILAGPLYVVSGTLRNAADVAPASRSVLALRLYDVSGRPLDSESAMLGPALTERQIRESGPDELIARLELGAARWSHEPLASGATRRFHAILREVPRLAVSYRFESVPLLQAVP